MNELLTRNRPLLCSVSDVQMAEFIQMHLGIDCCMQPFEPDPASELIPQFDRMNPDCAVVLLNEATKDNLTEWIDLRQYCDTRHIPFVILMDKDDKELKCALLADAVLFQPVDVKELQLVIKKLLERRQRILDQILIDPLTGAFNYRYLQREVQTQLNDMKRSHETFSMVYLEVDPKPSIDAKCRHALTKGLVDFIQGSIRPTDCMGHHAVEGFVMILPKTVKSDALKLMHRLTALFSKVPIDTPRGTLYGSFSAKVREFVDSNRSADECLKMMPFSNETDPTERSGLVLDGTMNDNETKTRKLMLAIIDDDRLIREMLKHQFSDIGESLYDVEIKEFADGEQFFNDPWHRQNERYIVIIDRIMPKMDGLEVLHKIRTGYDRRRYVCIMLSSKGSETDIAMAIQRGANDYMVKPFSLKELRVRIKRLVGGLR
ncbi:response regulator [Paenibacillus sp. GCM10023248]|uniref:response regulator n=1 Tax=unclassified Paenibacillus TaxID=185978 RepID=UPI0023780ABB|nr:response regulator [Paenibacillus sp. MAHUQ-63]MDD9268458.1 response regulator [Paenibacillus sp. MAHUQ-63]